jgi:gliding motility-associated lipoprotein GldH
MTLPKHFLGILLLGLSLVSCDKPNWIIERQFASENWPIQDTVNFSFEKQKPEPVEIRLQLQLDVEYAYRNIWLKLLMENPDGERSEIMIGDTLMDEAGNWYPESSAVSGRSVKHTIQHVPPIDLTQKGDYRMALIQYMREDKLQGVQKLWIAVD